MLHALGLVWLPFIFPSNHILFSPAGLTKPTYFHTARYFFRATDHPIHVSCYGSSRAHTRDVCGGSRAHPDLGEGFLPGNSVWNSSAAACTTHGGVSGYTVQDEGNRKENLDTTASEYQLVDNTVFSNRQNVSLPSVIVFCREVNR